MSEVLRSTPGRNCTFGLVARSSRLAATVVIRPPIRRRRCSGLRSRPSVGSQSRPARSIPATRRDGRAARGCPRRVALGWRATSPHVQKFRQLADIFRQARAKLYDAQKGGLSVRCVGWLLGDDIRVLLMSAENLLRNNLEARMLNSPPKLGLTEHSCNREQSKEAQHRKKKA